MNVLAAAARPPAELLIRAAHVIDPRLGINAPHDVLVREGEIAEIGSPGSLQAPIGSQTLEGCAKSSLEFDMGEVDAPPQRSTPSCWG